MVKKSFEGQFDDEKVLYVFRKHPVFMRKGIIVFMLCLLLGVVPVFFDPRYVVYFGGLAVGFVVGLIAALPYWVSWNYSYFLLTDQRFIQVTQKGFLHRSVADVNLPLIQSINYEIMGLEQTLLGYGTIIMQTYVGDSRLHYIHHPAQVQRKLVELMKQIDVKPDSRPINARVLTNNQTDDEQENR